MKIAYDCEVDALYLKLGEEKPEGVTKSLEGVHLGITLGGRLIGIEILEASNRIDLKTILSYTLKLDENILKECQI